MIALYGLLAGELLARRREIGIRLALGARHWQLRAWLMRPGFLLVALGVSIGVTASVPVARAAQSQLFGVGADSVGARAIAAVLLLAADVAGRVVAPPSEVQAGIMTAVVGAPVFIALVARRRVAAL